MKLLLQLIFEIREYMVVVLHEYHSSAKSKYWRSTVTPPILNRGTRLVNSFKGSVKTEINLRCLRTSKGTQISWAFNTSLRKMFGDMQLLSQKKYMYFQHTVWCFIWPYKQELEAKSKSNTDSLLPYLVLLIDVFLNLCSKVALIFGVPCLQCPRFWTTKNTCKF